MKKILLIITVFCVAKHLSAQDTLYIRAELLMSDSLKHEHELHYREYNYCLALFMTNDSLTIFCYFVAVVNKTINLKKNKIYDLVIVKSIRKRNKSELFQKLSKQPRIGYPFNLVGSNYFEVEVIEANLIE